jgi:hypothetical protein
MLPYLVFVAVVLYLMFGYSTLPTFQRAAKANSEKPFNFVERCCLVAVWPLFLFIVLVERGSPRG